MFNRLGAAALKKDLHNTIALCAAIDNPQNKFKTIHIAGTNGKGSTSHMLAAILQKAGYKTGLYTSPHLKDFRERIRINGKMVPKSFISNFVREQKNLIEEIEPSFFEVTVAMAFDYFAQEKVDIAVIEVGLGGRLDSTNIITPILSVITNISLDHTNILGDSLSQIASEKAGIIKRNVPVIVGEKQPEIENVFIEKAKLESAPLKFADVNWQLTVNGISGSLLSMNLNREETFSYPNLQLDLTGNYQSKNVLTVVEAIHQLKKIGYLIPTEAVYAALKDVKGITGLQGRWQTLSIAPLIICDTGHNKAGMKEVLKNIELTTYRDLHFVIGMVKDKDIDGVLAILPSKATYYFCSPNLERALAPSDLARAAAAYHLQGKAYQSVTDALAAAKKSAQVADLIFVGGSTFVVAEII